MIWLVHGLLFFIAHYQAKENKADYPAEHKERYENHERQHHFPPPFRFGLAASSSRSICPEHSENCSGVHV